MVISLIASTAPVSDGGSSTVVIVVAIVTVVGTIATAMGPTFVEMAKRQRASAAPAAPAPVPASPAAPAQPGAEPVVEPVSPSTASPNNPLNSVVRNGIDALSMVDAAVQDYRRQRDDALRRVDSLQQQLDHARATISDQLVQMAQLRGRLAQYEPNYERQPPMYPPGPSYRNDDNDWRQR